jgi:hypothetical protein
LLHSGETLEAVFFIFAFLSRNGFEFIEREQFKVVESSEARFFDESQRGGHFIIFYLKIIKLAIFANLVNYS